jgi:hypothetical protein
MTPQAATHFLTDGSIVQRTIPASPKRIAAIGSSSELSSLLSELIFFIPPDWPDPFHP